MLLVVVKFKSSLYQLIEFSSFSRIFVKIGSIVSIISFTYHFPYISNIPVWVSGYKNLDPGFDVTFVKHDWKIGGRFLKGARGGHQLRKQAYEF